MEYDGLDIAMNFGRGFVRLIQYGAPQHVMPIAAAMFEQTGQSSGTVPVS